MRILQVTLLIVNAVVVFFAIYTNNRAYQSLKRWASVLDKWQDSLNERTEALDRYKKSLDDREALFNAQTGRSN